MVLLQSSTSFCFSISNDVSGFLLHQSSYLYCFIPSQVLILIVLMILFQLFLSCLLFWFYYLILPHPGFPLSLSEIVLSIFLNSSSQSSSCSSLVFPQSSSRACWAPHNAGEGGGWVPTSSWVIHHNYPREGGPYMPVRLAPVLLPPTGWAATSTASAYIVG